jgi:tripartite-type tricarboxylate transporter receptor subunit TctC
LNALRPIAGALMLTAVACTPAAAQSIGPKPIHIIVPVAAGAATDLLGRIAGDWLGKKTGLPIVVENRTGAGGNIALEQVAKGEPDGHTLLVATNGAITINRALYKNDPSRRDPVDTLTDVVPVAGLAWFPNILVINSTVPAKTAQEFIALAKAKPGSINYGSAGPGTTPHLGTALFARLAGIDMVHVPYRGMAPALTDLVANNVQAVTLGYGTVKPFVEQDSLRVLAVAGPERLSYLPDVPAAAEIGLPDWQVETWWGLFAPHGTPPAVVHEINAQIAGMFDDPANRKRFEESFYDPMKMSADQFAQRVRSDVARWERIVKETGVDAQ